MMELDQHLAFPCKIEKCSFSAICCGVHKFYSIHQLNNYALDLVIDRYTAKIIIVIKAILDLVKIILIDAIILLKLSNNGYFTESGENRRRHTKTHAR